MNYKKHYKIIDTDIIDLNCENNIPDNECLKSSVSILVKITLLNGITVYIDFQISDTSDYGAISSVLAAHDGATDYSTLHKYCDINGIDIYELLDDIKTSSSAQSTWNNYIDATYKSDDERYNGMDARSEYNHTTRKVPKQ